MEEIVAKHPFIAQSVRIRVLNKRKESICLRAEVYGCGIPRGKTWSFLDEDAEAIYILPWVLLYPMIALPTLMEVLWSN